jgi:N-acetylneuraminic acid mutarotase
MSHHRVWQRLCSFFALAGLALGLVQPAGVVAAPSATGNANPASSSPALAKPVPVVRSSLKNDTSLPLRDLTPSRGHSKAPIPQKELGAWSLPLPKAANGAAQSNPNWRDPLWQNQHAPQVMPTPIANFDGLSDDDNENVHGGRYVPPDTNGDIGYDPATGTKYYVQWINIIMAIWDVTNPASPTLVYGPALGGDIWDGFGGICETNDDGDPIALFDAQANRWLISQFALFGVDGFHQCVAVSQTADPTGAWHRYDFLISATKLNDYPKFGVWPDGYYMSINQFDGFTFAYAGAGVVAFERDQMLAGLPADMVYFDLEATDPNLGGMLPSDLDGMTTPPAGSPNYFMEVDDGDLGAYPTDRIQIFEFDVDWATPANSTFTGPTVIDLEALGYAYDSNMCGFARDCIPELDGEDVDAISDRLMYRLAYRNYGSHEALVLNHTVDVDGTDHAGVRWYEVRDPGGTPTVYQAGTYAPDDDHRWMASAAMDHNGNLAIGYSVSNSDMYPAIRYAGRLQGDPLGTLAQGEAELITGDGSQASFSFNRWGDYSMMGIDPVDDCTFWYTQEYYANTEAFDFKTRIGSFKFPSCSIGPQGILTGTVTDVDTSAPIAAASIQASLSPTLTFGTSSNATGGYSIYLPVGTYTVTASAYGYFPTSVSGIGILSGTTTIQDFALTPLPSAVVNGTVTDGSGHLGMPLYAQINISAPGFSDVIFTDPETGAYNTTLFLNQPYSFTVTAIGGGYDGVTVNVTPTTDPFTQNFALTVSAVCTAAGYQIVGGLLEPFESGELPDGWSIVDNIGNGQVWEFDDPGGRGNLTGGTGLFAIMDSDNYGPGNEQDTELWTPVLDFTGQTTVTLQFDSDYFNLGDTADVDVSNNSGATWTNVWQRTVSEFGPYHATIDITAQAANQNDVIVRFHNYNAFWAWWWEVDNVSIGNLVCDPVAGGRIVGNVYDANTGGGLNGATVSDGADDTTTFATPLDDAQDDGFYIFFGPAASTTLTATFAGGYAPDAHDVAAVTDAVVSQDFSLGAGFLSYDPASLHATVDLGDSTTLPFTLSNTGAGDATFELKERDNGFVPNIIGVVRPVPEGVGLSSGDGAPLRRLSGQFFPGSLAKYLGSGGAPPQGSEADAPGAPTDAPWTDIADYPFDIMDSTGDWFDGLIYSAAGIDGGLSFLDTLYVYDPETDTWTQLASMSEVREKPAAAFVDGLLYVVGGWDNFGTPVATLEIYDPDSDTWTTGADIPTAYAAATAVALDGQLYVIGGCDSFACGFTEVFRYDPGGDAWEQLADYPENISWVACDTIDGLIYCAGGVSDAGESDHTYVYDPDADAWTQLADMIQTQWATGFTAVDGLLYISGGVTDNFATVTNESFVYDPDSDVWTQIENSNNSVYRGASACGWYKIGGSTGGFTPDASSEVYPGLENCEAGGGDAIWLSEAPISGTVPSASDQPITITFDASVVQQPGDYVAELKIKDNTPYEALVNVPVTMTVPVPSGWGQAHGHVYGLGHCDLNPVLLDGATIDLTTSTGVTATLTQEEDAPWSWWAPAGPLTVTVSADDHLSQTVVLNLVAGQGTNEDTNLRWLHSCGSVSPTTVELSPQINTLSAVSINLVNSGTVTWTWSLSESSSWLSISGAASGATAADSSSASELTINTSGMLLGTTYTAILYVSHDDDLAPEPLAVLVRVTVSSEAKLYLPILLK